MHHIIMMLLLRAASSNPVPSIMPSSAPSALPTLIPTNLPTSVPTQLGVKTIRLGYFAEPQPFETACSRGWFDHPSNLSSVACFLQGNGALAVSNLD